MSTNTMPARIWVWSGTPSGWTSKKFVNDIPAAAYIRADIVERLAGAAAKFVAVCSDKRGEWNGMHFIDHDALVDSFSEARSALAAYRESINDKA